MRRVFMPLAVVLFSIVGPSMAYAQQSVSVHLGAFVPRSEDARVDGDVLFNNQTFYTFDIEGFKGATFGADWLIPLNDRIEAGLGAGMYTKNVPSFYTYAFNIQTGGDVTQKLKLRMIPLNATFRLVPFGVDAAVQPYIGGGVSVTSWRYSEAGDFVDFDANIFHGRFQNSGWTAGPLILGGVRFAATNGLDLGAEFRHQSGAGKLDPLDFTGATKIDLGGFSYLATLKIRF
jgi:opacity protein-like surface antigen